MGPDCFEWTSDCYVTVTGVQGREEKEVRMPLQILSYFKIPGKFIASTRGNFNFLNLYTYNRTKLITFYLDRHSLLGGGANKATTMSLTSQIGGECQTVVTAVHRFHHSKYYYPLLVSIITIIK